MARRSGRFDTRGGMGKFKITVARIELAGRGSQVRITFQSKVRPRVSRCPSFWTSGTSTIPKWSRQHEAACTERSSSSRPNANSGS